MSDRKYERIINPTFSERIHEANEKVKDFGKKTAKFIWDNKEIIIVATPVVLSVVTPIVKSVTKHNNLLKEEDLKNLYYYDRSQGHYWKLRRELSGREFVDIAHRRQAGEKLVDILDDLRVLDDKIR